MSKKRTNSNVDYSGSDPWAPRVPVEQSRGLQSRESAALVPSPPTAGPSKRARTESSSQNKQTSVPTITERFSPKEKTERILDLLIDGNRYGLGDFLAFILKAETFDGLTGSRKGVVTRWIRSGSRPGSRPADIVDAIYRHPSAIQRDDNVVRQADFSDLKPPSEPPTFTAAHPRSVSLLPSVHPSNKERFNAREGVAEVMVRGTLCLVEQEAARLAEGGLARGANLTWKDAEDQSKTDQRDEMHKLAPVIWAIFSTMALNRNGSQATGSDTVSATQGSGNPVDSTQEKTKLRDSTLVSLASVP